MLKTAIVAKKIARLSTSMLPEEFLIFSADQVISSKGEFVFDSQAAELVMQSYERAGVDVMIDLEHLSVDQGAPNYDPDARGWCKLELREGALWAVDVRWTPDGERRLKERAQRYISPCFFVNSENGRIEELVNIAICAIPATYDTPALVAASRRSGKRIESLSIEVTKMNEELAKIAQMLGLDPENATVDEILEAIRACQESAIVAEKRMSEDTEEEKALSKLPKKIEARVRAALSGKDALEQRIADLESATRKNEIESLISDNTDKIPKSLEAWARSCDPDTLREFVKHAVSSTAKPRVEPSEITDPDKIELTKEELQIARLTSMDPEKILAQKQLEFKLRKENKVIHG
jgi:phage I-like protein